MPGAQQVVDASPQFRMNLKLNTVGLQVHAAAVLQAEHELQHPVAGIATHNFPNLRQHLGSVFGLIDADQDPGCITRIQFVERNQLVDDQVGLVTTSTIDRAADNQDSIVLDQMAVFHEIVRPDNAADRSGNVFEVEIRVFRGGRSRPDFRAHGPV